LVPVLTGPDIEKRLTRFQFGVVENSVANSR
jgi:hypothetical protein